MTGNSQTKATALELPQEYPAEYLKMLRLVAEKHHDRTDELSAFIPQCGDDYMTSVRLVVVGRAVNQWEWAGLPSKMEHEDQRTSALWRVAKRIHDAMMGVCQNWSRQLCWSNLYKLARASGRNPQTLACVLAFSTSQGGEDHRTQKDANGDYA
jgi:hypothetical protein